MLKSKNLKFIVLSVFFLFASLHFLRTTIGIAKNNRRLEGIQGEVLDLEAELMRAKKSLAYQETDEFIEEQARNKLNLIKPNEQIFVLDKDLEAEFEKKILGLNVASAEEAKKEEKSNIQQWFDLIL